MCLISINKTDNYIGNKRINNFYYINHFFFNIFSILKLQWNSRFISNSQLEKAYN